MDLKEIVSGGYLGDGVADCFFVHNSIFVVFRFEYDGDVSEQIREKEMTQRDLAIK